VPLCIKAGTCYFIASEAPTFYDNLKWILQKKVERSQMMQFTGGIIVTLLVFVPVFFLLLRRRPSEAQQDQGEPVAQLEELTKLTGELAHELKNPLSTIKVNLRLIREELEATTYPDSSKAGPDKDEPKFSRALRKMAVIQKEADRLQQILDGFLRYINKPELQFARIDINELVGDMIDFYSPQTYSHSITVRQSLCKEPLICKVDAVALKQVILNLLINAQQAIGSDGELMIRTSRQRGGAVIQISDTGCGIAADKLQSIFEPYYSSRPEGTGLGLASARKIIEAHNGTIAVASELGKGTAFTIRLPLLEPNSTSNEVSN
jgi:signal transduction histidine kinase